MRRIIADSLELYGTAADLSLRTQKPASRAIKETFEMVASRPA